MAKKPTKQKAQNPLAATTCERPSRSRAVRALHAAIAERPETNALFRAMWDYQFQKPDVQHDDRATALVLGSFLEQALEDGILTHCAKLEEDERRKLFGSPQEAPISFDIKIRLGFALGIYGPDSRDDLTFIRHIRNIFAHAKTDIRFDSTVVEDLCGHLKYVDKMHWGGIIGPKPNTARLRFIETVRHYFVWLATEPEDGNPLRYQSYVFPDLYA